MEKIITVGTKEVKMKSTAGTLTRYRMAFKRDLMKDLFILKSRFERINKSDEEQFKMMDLQMFEQVAWALAKTADNNIPSIETWLDNFDTFDIYTVLPEIMEMLIGNMQSISEKKNLVPEEVRKN